ncbi:MAG TPA: Mrp/NBP35 family ATP-binding protein [Bacteroidales bacterium]|nr:Mrp/NBP35 family ATP-binding protein [Bacteroidales bacterium]HNS46918.1 Mrp/NBP35 family ATP-binding protein [Bacteroidales bacterium]
MHTKEQITNALRHVQDPDLKKDLVTLNMIENIEIQQGKVTFTLVLTTPACPLKGKMKQDCIEAIHQYVDPELEVVVELTSRVTSRRKETQELLKGVKNIIAIASGKGGVGKSTIAANLAVAMGQTGARVGLLDADIYGPSIPVMFGLQAARPDVVQIGDKPKIIPITRHGIQVLSIGFFVDASQALIWRGPMASNALMQLFKDAEWGELDYLIVDTPPGTGDIHLTLAQQVPMTGVAIVTTPQEVALADARKAITMFRQDQIRVPVLGLIENMSWFTPAELPGNRYYLFGKEGGKRLAEEYGIPLLGQVPIVQSICESGDEGLPVVLEDDAPESSAFRQMTENIAQQIAIGNA